MILLSAHVMNISPFIQISLILKKTIILPHRKVRKSIFTIFQKDSSESRIPDITILVSELVKT